MTADDYRAEADSLAQNLKFKEALQVNNRGRIKYPDDMWLVVQCAAFKNAIGEFEETIALLDYYKDKIAEDEVQQIVADGVRDRCERQVTH